MLFKWMDTEKGERWSEKKCNYFMTFKFCGLTPHPFSLAVVIMILTQRKKS